MNEQTASTQLEIARAYIECRRALPEHLIMALEEIIDSEVPAFYKADAAALLSIEVCE